MMSKLLLWLQERIKHWTKPVLVSGYLSDLTRSRTDLIVENALLRQQLIVLNRQIKRPQLTNPDRFHLVLLAHFTKFWKQSPGCLIGIRAIIRSRQTEMEETNGKATPTPP